MDKIVKGYKVFNSDWTCRDKQYTCPGTFEEDIEPDVCRRGLHFCKKARDCFNYYSFSSNNHVAEVIAYGDVKESGNKCCTNKLKIVRELSWHEVLDIVNTGENCTGYRNSGNYNSGNYNSGDCNSGNYNSGYRNSGDWNSGDWNKTNHSNGCFNTIQPKIKLFNKESDLTYNDWVLSEARKLLNEIPTEILRWVPFNNMSEEEKEVNPNAKNTDGYLEMMKPHECAQDWWNRLEDTNKKIILDIPNFDKEIFKEITGIDVNMEV